MSYMTNGINVELDPYGIDWYKMPADEKQEYLNRWRTPNAVVYETESFRLRCFRGGFGDAIIIDPPCSGHDSKLADWDKDQSLVQAALDGTNRPVYVIDYKGYSAEQGVESYDSIIQDVIDSIEFTRTGKAHLISLCQSGPVGAIIAAQRPDVIASLTVAGSPINPHACKSILDQAIKQPMDMYRMVVDSNKGMMPGKVMLECWMSSNPVMHRITRWERETLESYRAQRFAAWYYNSTQDIGGGWYLTAVEEIFKKNSLYKGEFVAFDYTVDLNDIQCPVRSVYGTKDEISPKEHAIALKEFVMNHKTYTTEGGHIGVFMGRKSIAETWSKIFADIGDTDVSVEPIAKVVANEGSIVYDGAVVGKGARAFKSTFVYPTAVLGIDSMVGNGCEITGIVAEGEKIKSNSER